MASLTTTINLGVALLQEGKPDRAAELHRDVLRRSPENPEALRLLSVAVYQLGDSQQAADLAEPAVQLSLTAADYRSNLGRYYLSLERLKEVVDSLGQAIKLASSHGLAHFNLAAALGQGRRLLNEFGAHGLAQSEYITCRSDWEWLPGTVEAIACFHRAGYEVIVDCNQTGVPLGSLTAAVLGHIHRRMRAQVEQGGGRIDAIDTCPDHWAGCVYPKPRPGMWWAAQRDFHLHLRRTFFLGDQRNAEAAIVPRNAAAAAAPPSPYIAGRDLFTRPDNFPHFCSANRWLPARCLAGEVAPRTTDHSLYACTGHDTWTKVSHTVPESVAEWYLNHGRVTVGATVLWAPSNATVFNVAMVRVTVPCVLKLGHGALYASSGGANAAFAAIYADNGGAS